MLELQVTRKTGSISSNFEEIENALDEYLKDYKGIIVTQDSISKCKKDVAELRKRKESIEDARKKVKNEWMVPYNDFEAKCKALVGKVDNAIDEINSQLKLFEEDRKAEKKEHIKKLYDENIGDLKAYLPFDVVFNTKWTNASVKDQDIIYELSEKKIKVTTDLNAIAALNSEIYDELINAYIDSGNNITAAIQRNNQYLADKNRAIDAIKEKELIEKTNEEEPHTNRNCTPDITLDTSSQTYFIVAKEDAEEVKGLLKLSGIVFSILGEE